MEAKVILVVEDDADLRELVVGVLEAHGYRVQEAQHGQEALDRVADHMPHLVLLDMKMPVMDGRAFVAELRARYGNPVPIVVMTAAESAASRAQELSAQGWLSKPFDAEDLIQEVKAQLSAGAAT